MSDWQDIASAPKDGSEILVWRDDCGVLLARWTCLAEFLTEAELVDCSEDVEFQEDWFYADFISGGRLEGSEVPTHWVPLPAPPTSPQALGSALLNDIPTLANQAERTRLLDGG